MNLVVIGSGDSLSPARHQAIIRGTGTPHCTYDVIITSLWRQTTSFWHNYVKMTPFDVITTSLLSNVSAGSWKVKCRCTMFVSEWVVCRSIRCPFAKTFLSDWTVSGLILGLRPANERRRYSVTTSLIGWAQAWNQSCVCSTEDGFRGSPVLVLWLCALVVSKCEIGTSLML